MSDIVERLLRFRPVYGWPEETSTVVEKSLNQVAVDEITRLRTENEMLREALKPLESELTELDKEIPEWVKKTKDSDLLGWTYVLTLGDLRRARAILEGATK